MLRAFLAAFTATVIFAGCASPASEDAASSSDAVSRAPKRTAEILRALGGMPCPTSSEFTCVKLSVPLDHFANGAAKKKIDVTFGVKPATGTRRGTFVVVHGGPGSSGIERLDSFSSYDSRIPESFDVVHFDLRSVGLSGDLECPVASAIWRTRGPVGSEADERDVTDRARRFATECVREIGAPAEDLPFYSTRQAVEDLEAFRKVFEEDKLYIYGMSYGTQYGQYYARSHPDRVAQLIIDGVVDTTLTLNGYGESVVHRQNDMLGEVLDACKATPSCAGEFGRDPASAYDELAATLRAGPAHVERANTATGERETRLVTAGDLDLVVSGSLKTAAKRRDLQKLLASATKGQLADVLDKLYEQRGLDGDTLEPKASTDSDAGYYVITCNDYTLAAETGASTPDEAARAYLAAGRRLGAAGARIKNAFYHDLPCAFWPRGEDNARRPPPLVLREAPVMVISAKGDPITPFTQGESVLASLADGWLVLEDSGTHVSWGYGNDCPDKVVSALLVDGKRPSARRTTCPGALVGP